MWLYALPGETVLVDALFLSKIWQTESEFNQSPEWSPLLLWKAWKPFPAEHATFKQYSIIFNLSYVLIKMMLFQFYLLPCFLLDFSFSKFLISPPYSSFPWSSSSLVGFSLANVRAQSPFYWWSCEVVNVLTLASATAESWYLQIIIQGTGCLFTDYMLVDLWRVVLWSYWSFSSKF